MKYLHLIAVNLLRRKIRTLLTLGSYAVALFLFGILVAIRGAFVGGFDVVAADRLGVMNKVSLIQPLPYAYWERLKRLDGVRQVTHMTWFGGVYKDERNFFPQFAVDPGTYLDLYPELKVPEDQWRDFAADRAGCVVGAALAGKYGFKLGDRITLKGTIYPGTWDFNVRGIFTATRPQDDTSQLWFRWDYLDERAPSFLKGYVGWYQVRVQHPDDAVGMVKTIDEGFANSPWETRTMTEQAMMASIANQIGNVGFLLMAIGSVVFFTLLLVSGNTMAIAVRDRIPELAVLKTLGFTDRFLLLLVMAESIGIAALGDGLGLALAKIFTLQGDPMGGMMAGFYLPAGALAAGLGLTLAMGAAAGLLPAIAAMRLRVVEGLRRV